MPVFFRLVGIDGRIGIVVVAADPSAADLPGPREAGLPQRIVEGPGEAAGKRDLPVGIEARPRRLRAARRAAGHHEAGRQVVGVGRAAARLLAGVERVDGKIVRVLEIALARLDPRVENAAVGGEAQEAQAGAGRGEIGVVAEIGEIADGVDIGARLIQPQRFMLKLGPSVTSKKSRSISWSSESK